MIHFIHGIRTEPTSPVRGLVPYLVEAGLKIAYPDYGFELEFETRIVNPMIVGALLPYIQPGDIGIGHSNGCAILYDLLTAGASFERLVFINGALETNFLLPPTLKSLDVFFNSGDTITEAAAIAEKLGWVDKVWGELGHAGYHGKDPRVTNIDCGITKDMPVVSGHSDFFSPLKLKEWAPFLAKRII
jgi:hypothetical protein